MINRGHLSLKQQKASVANAELVALSYFRVSFKGNQSS